MEHNLLMIHHLKFYLQEFLPLKSTSSVSYVFIMELKPVFLYLRAYFSFVIPKCRKTNVELLDAGNTTYCTYV